MSDSLAFLPKSGFSASMQAKRLWNAKHDEYGALRRTEEYHTTTSASNLNAQKRHKNRRKRLFCDAAERCAQRRFFPLSSFLFPLSSFFCPLPRRVKTRQGWGRNERGLKRQGQGRAEKRAGPVLPGDVPEESIFGVCEGSSFPFPRFSAACLACRRRLIGIAVCIQGHLSKTRRSVPQLSNHDASQPVQSASPANHKR
jgi:hypothetical protein